MQIETTIKWSSHNSKEKDRTTKHVDQAGLLLLEQKKKYWDHCFGKLFGSFCRTGTHTCPLLQRGGCRHIQTQVWGRPQQHRSQPPQPGSEPAVRQQHEARTHRSLLTRWNPTQRGKGTASPCSDTDESHARRCSKLDPKEGAPWVPFTSSLCVRPSFIRGKFLFGVSQARLPSGRRHGMRTGRAQVSCWEGAGELLGFCCPSASDLCIYYTDIGKLRKSLLKGVVITVFICISCIRTTKKPEIVFLV